MKVLIQLVTRIEATLAFAAAIILAAVMVIVSADVAMRYVFNQPFGWSYDLISLYLTLALFYFCLSRAFDQHAHVGVDILHYYVSRKTRLVFNAITCVASAPVFALIALECGKRAAATFAHHDVLAGAIAWPTWAFIVLAPIGAGLLTVRLLLNAVAYLVPLFGGPETIPLPALARSDEGIEQAAFE
ncbi:MAG TPA: TRAP transporter small permease [Alphaproteobacteria bacterium]|nr:TRAP transporter small permease [Alphaproteobacteria bacterium]